MAAEEGTESARRVADVLLTVAESRSPIGVNDLARRVGVSPATVHRILRALVSRSLVAQDSQQRYHLGTAAMVLGNQAIMSTRLRQASEASLDRLAAVTGFTATLSALAGARRIYLDQRLGSAELSYTVQLGKPYSLALGSSGRAMLAFLPDDIVERILSLPIPAEHGPAASVDRDELAARLDDVRDAGIAVSRNERIAGAGGMAAPIRSADGAVLGAINIMGAAADLDEAKVAMFRELLLEESTRITSTLEMHEEKGTTNGFRS